MNFTSFSKTFSLQEGELIAHQLIELLKKHRIMTFSGQLGAGKTTLIKKMVAALGYHGVVSSPTFTYVQIYPLAVGKRICHFDLYRITSIEQFFQLGLDEFLDDENSYAVIEWPERIAELLAQTLHVAIEIAHVEHDQNVRLISMREIK